MEAFRESVRTWLDENFSDGIRSSPEGSDARKGWTKTLADKGWICPTWPKEYGGAGLNFDEHITLVQELSRASAHPPPDVQ